VYARTLGTVTAVGRRKLKLKGRPCSYEVTKTHQTFVKLLEGGIMRGAITFTLAKYN
jgi:hypothetical protein